MPSQVTLTGPTGPARTMTAQVFQNASQVILDLDRKIIQVVQSQGRVTPIEMDIAATTTITDTITSGNHAIVVSQ